MVAFYGTVSNDGKLTFIKEVSACRQLAGSLATSGNSVLHLYFAIGLLPPKTYIWILSNILNT